MTLHSHFLLMLLFAFFVAVVGATLIKDDLREQVRTGGQIFGTLVGAGLVLGWVLFFFPI